MHPDEVETGSGRQGHLPLRSVTNFYPVRPIDSTSSGALELIKSDPSGSSPGWRTRCRGFVAWAWLFTWSGRFRPPRGACLTDGFVAAMALPNVKGVPRFSARHLIFVGPLVLLHLTCGLVFVVGASRVATTVFVITCVVQLFGLTMGYHRLLAHRFVQDEPGVPVRPRPVGNPRLLARTGRWWVGHHIHHHRYADQEDDIHSPRAGIFWSHMGWLFSPRIIPIRYEMVTALARLPEMRLLQQYSYVVSLVYALLLYLLGVVWHVLDPPPGSAVRSWSSGAACSAQYASITSRCVLAPLPTSTAPAPFRRRTTAGDERHSCVSAARRRLAQQSSLLSILGTNGVPMVGVRLPNYAILRLLEADRNRLGSESSAQGGYPEAPARWRRRRQMTAEQKRIGSYLHRRPAPDALVEKARVAMDGCLPSYERSPHQLPPPA